MARLYSNENTPLPTVQRLRELGHDVLTSHEAGNSNRQVPDDAVLAFAEKENRVMLTNNRRHFHGLHTSGQSHRGIVSFTTDRNFEALANRIDACLQEAPEGRFLGKVTLDGHTFT